MKTPEKWDVSNYIVHQTEGFEVEPPDSIWNNIENSISHQAPLPNKAFSFFKSNILFITVFSITVIVGITMMVYFITSQNNTVAEHDIVKNVDVSENINSTVANVNENSSEIKNEIVAPIANNKPVETVDIKTEKKISQQITPDKNEKIEPQFQETKETLQQTNNSTDLTTENNQSITSEKILTKTWNLNLNSYKKVSKISVYDNTGKEVLSDVPKKKNPGMYPLNITTLKKGVYAVKVEVDGKLMDLTTIKVD